MTSHTKGRDTLKHGRNKVKYALIPDSRRGALRSELFNGEQEDIYFFFRVSKEMVENNSDEMALRADLYWQSARPFWWTEMPFVHESTRMLTNQANQSFPKACSLSTVLKGNPV